MNTLFHLLDTQPLDPFTRLMTERVGWTLVHFLWQGLLIAVVYAAVRACLGRSASAQARYVLACSALIAMLAAPVATLTVLQPRDHPSVSTPYVAVPIAPATQAAVIAPSEFLRLPVQTEMRVPAVPHNQLLTWFVLFWLVGALAFSLRLIIGCFAAAHLRFRSVRLAPPEWQQKLDELGSKIRVSHPVRLMVSTWAEAPAVVGWLRPVVLVPVGALTGLPPDQIEALLLHELAHVRRYDYLVNILQSVVEALLFYHPAVWWISGHIRTEREACCDDLAVSASGDVLTYVRALTELASLRPTSFGSAVAATGGSLANRVARLLGTPRTTTEPQPISAGVVVALLLLVTGFGVVAQTTRPLPSSNPPDASTSGPTFEAADVHVSPRSNNPFTFGSGNTLQGGRYDLRKATMLDLIQVAWNVDPATVFGGPNWLAFDRFDVSAKAPPQTPPETIHLMLQALLKERFGLVLHQDTRPLPAFVLRIEKGGKPKLQKSSGEGNTGCDIQQADVTSAAVQCRNMTMTGFATWLHNNAGDYLRAPVVDTTDLGGAWDFDLKWNRRAATNSSDTPRITIFDAVEKQLGLTLTLAAAPEPVIVVDRVNEKPAPNPPGVEKLLPPRPSEFEVAVLKPSRPDEKPLNRVYPGGRLEFRASDLKTLIGYAFDMNWDVMDELTSGLPAWAGSAHFDIDAKPPVETFGPPGFPWQNDDLRVMTRNLLIERFGMKTHYEDRPVSVWTLVSVKPKMKPGDPTHRASCKEAAIVPNDPRDSNPMLSRLVTCQSVTMTQFAAQLQVFVSDDFAFPAEDATGLKGVWDFTLSFTPPYLLQLAQSAHKSTSEGAASDPSGGISIFEAVSKLGLKLEKRKRLAPVLVIDHIEEKPEEN